MKDKIWLFYGEAGTWKTTVASKFENVLLISFDPGYKFIHGVYATAVANWDQFKKIFEELKLPAVKKKFDTIFIDGIDIAARMAQTYVENGKEMATMPHGTGWAKYKAELSKFSRIPQLGYGYGFIAHTKNVTDKDGKVTGVKLNLDASTRDFVMPLVDIALYVQKEVREGVDPINVTEDDMVCYAYTGGPVEGLDTKRRARYMDDKILFTYDSLEDALTRAIKKQGEIEGFEPVLVNKTYARSEEAFNQLIKEVEAAVSKNLEQFPESENDILDFVVQAVGTLDLKSLSISDADKLANLKKHLEENE